MKNFFAHSVEGKSESEWQELEAHPLFLCHSRAMPTGRQAGIQKWGYLAGLWHDLGKYSEVFQRCLTVVKGEASL